MLKRQIESIEVDWERADTGKYYQTVNQFRKGFQPCLNAYKDYSGKLIERDDKILEHWVRYSKLNFKKNTVKRRVMKKAFCNLKINTAPVDDDNITELIKNASQELKKRLHALICKI